MDTIAILNKAQLRDIWLEKSWSQGETFHLYIQNPFCPTECLFCKHQGLKTRIGSDLYLRYYLDYLPSLICHFGEVLRSHPLDTVYFGGGTSSMMTVDLMESLFQAIPSFAEIRFKTFECNPSMMNEEKVDVLRAHRFTYVSFGVQTFDKRILAANNRPSIPLNRLRELVERFQNERLAVNCDLITFIDQRTTSDLNQLTADLRTLAEQVRPDTITVYAETFALLGSPEITRLAMVRDLRSTLESFEVDSAGSYRLSVRDRDRFLSQEDIRDRLTTDYRLVRTDAPPSILQAVTSYNCSGGMRAPTTQSTLGLGSLTGEKDPAYSYIRRDFYCNEVNRGWVPEYHVLYDRHNLAGLHAPY